MNAFFVFSIKLFKKNKVFTQSKNKLESIGGNSPVYNNRSGRESQEIAIGLSIKLIDIEANFRPCIESLNSLNILAYVLN